MAFLNQYCERTSVEFWAEPCNALTNLAFMMAAIACIVHLRRQHIKAAPVAEIVVLIVLMFAIALGSFLWHTLATPWAEMVDRYPILIFISIYLLSFLRRIVKLSWVWTLLWFGFYHVFNGVLQYALPPDFLNGSIFYLPTWLTLLLMAGYVACKCTQHFALMLCAVLIFSTGLICRTIDVLLCKHWPLGTHFLWHVLTAVLLYVLLRVLIQVRPIPDYS